MKKRLGIERLPNERGKESMMVEHWMYNKL